MRITYLHQYAVPHGGAGGIRSAEFARILGERGHEVTLITSSARFPERWTGGVRSRHTTIEGNRWIVIPVDYQNRMGFWRRLLAFAVFAIRSTWHTMTTPTDLIFASSTPLTVAIPALAGKLVRRVPLVFEVRDLWPEMAIATKVLTNPAAKLAARLLERTTYRWSDHIVALSPGMAEGVADDVGEAKVSIIPNACDIERFGSLQHNPDLLRDLLGFDPAGPVLVYGGTFGRLNNVGYLVDLAGEMDRIGSDCLFVLAGSGAEHGQVRLRAQELGLLNRSVFVLDEVEKSVMLELVAASTISCSVFQPILEMEKNSANKFFDALAAGRPVLINYGGWHAKLLQESGAGIVLDQTQPLSVQARELLDFLSSPGRVQAAEVAASTLAARFDRSTLGAQLGELLERVGQSAE